MTRSNWFSFSWVPSALVMLCGLLVSAGCELYIAPPDNGGDRGGVDEGPMDCVDCDPANAPGVPRPGDSPMEPGASCLNDGDCALGCFCALPADGSSDPNGRDLGTCTEAGFCRTDGDCGTGLTCDVGRNSCTDNGARLGVEGDSCLSDRNCIEGLRCLVQDTMDLGYCVPDWSEAPTTCIDTGDCFAGCICANGECSETGICLADEECVRGMYCDLSRVDVFGVGTCTFEPVAACAELNSAEECLARSDCDRIFAGENCNCADGSNACNCADAPDSCVCESYRYAGCIDVAPPMLP